jgi:transposase
MFFPEGQVRVFLYGQPVNMRLSFDGLYALAKHVMHQDPLSGNLFAFINRRATQIRVLYFDRSGLCVWAKVFMISPVWEGWMSPRQTDLRLACFVHGQRGIRPVKPNSTQDWNYVVDNATGLLHRRSCRHGIDIIFDIKTVKN